MAPKSEVIGKPGIIYTRNYSDYNICNSYDELLEITQRNRCIYEFISDKANVNMFFDIECKYNPTDKGYFDNPEILIDKLKESINKRFREEEYSKRYIILEAHNETKLSYHVIIRLSSTTGIPIVFKNVYSCKVLYNELNLPDTKIYDTSVYREGLFRTINSSKPKERRPFKLSELSDPISDLRETFVGYIYQEDNGISVNEIISFENNQVSIRRSDDNTNTNPSENQLSISEVLLTTRDNKQITQFIRGFFKHNSNYIREIFVDTQLNCIIVSLTEKYCEFINGEHKSNHQYIVIDSYSSKQKCHDTECEKQVYNEIRFDSYPEDIQSIVRRVLILNNDKIISEAVESVKTFINERFDREVKEITFDKNKLIFKGQASNILNQTIRGRCPNCEAEHQISSTGYCLRCLRCQSTFPKDLTIPVDHITNSVLGKFWTFINNGTVNNNITIINQTTGEEEFNCDVQLDNAIFRNKEVTKLLNQILDGHKVVLISQLMSKLDNDFKYTSGEWYHFNGSIWKADKESLEFRKHIVKLSSHFSKIQKFYESKRVDELQQLTNASIVKNVKSLINKLHKTGFEDEIIKGAKMYYYDENFISKLNSKKHLVPFVNGVYDLLSRNFRVAAKEDYINLTVSFEYERSIFNTEVQQFVNNILPNKGVRDYVLKKMSECLNGDIPNTNFLMFIGDGANGKSQLLNLMKLALGELGEKVEVTLLTRKRNNANEANSEKIKLLNKRFAFLSEPEDGEKINIGLLKELTGSEEIVARGLYQESMSFVMEAKLFLACNELPEIKGEDTALWRRIRVIDFPSRFVDEPKETNEYKIDRTLPSRMREDMSWRQTFINILLDYYYKDVPEPYEVQIKTNEYRQENNEFYNWLEDNIEVKDNSLLQLKDVCMLFLDKPKIHSKESSKYRKEIEKWIKERHKGLKWEYDTVKIGDKTHKGWKNFNIKENMS